MGPGPQEEAGLPRATHLSIPQIPCLALPKTPARGTLPRPPDSGEASRQAGWRQTALSSPLAPPPCTDPRPSQRTGFLRCTPHPAFVHIATVASADPANVSRTPPSPMPPCALGWVFRTWGCVRPHTTISPPAGPREDGLGQDSSRRHPIPSSPQSWSSCHPPRAYSLGHHRQTDRLM